MPQGSLSCDRRQRRPSEKGSTETGKAAMAEEGGQEVRVKVSLLGPALPVFPSEAYMLRSGVFFEQQQASARQKQRPDPLVVQYSGLSTGMSQPLLPYRTHLFCFWLVLWTVSVCRHFHGAGTHTLSCVSHMPFYRAIGTVESLQRVLGRRVWEIFQVH